MRIIRLREGNLRGVGQRSATHQASVDCGGFRLTTVLALALVSTIAMPAHAQEPKPARNDLNARLRPKEAVLTAKIVPADAEPGQKVKLEITAKLDPGYHIWAWDRVQQDEGPRNTSFDVFNTAGLKLAGDWSASTDPSRKHDPAFPTVKEVLYFEDQVTWSHDLEIPTDAAPGKKAIRVQASYMICNAKNCSIFGAWTLPDAVVTIKAGARPKSPSGGENSKPESADRPKVVSEVEKTAQQGIIPLIIASALGGLLALAMPCVWPMVPITVNFFVKQGQNGYGKTTGLAITYCLAIIGVFTSVGVLCSFFVSAAALPKLATSPWLNFGVAALFIAFGLSLLGLVEIRIPNFLLNASAQRESRGGLVGVIFMALTLTITSFTCTFPVVGGLLVMASTGEFFYPIVGLATFSAVLALPFFLLALAPGLLSKMPKSGDWMNTVKVVGGLVEIAAAFKFINQAETAFVTPENAWFDAQVVLTIWVVLASICGLYLLGLFRTDHDHEEVKVGPGRMVFGAIFLCLAVYMAPALFGRPPQSLVWGRVVMPMLPPDAADLEAKPTALASGESAPREQHATATDPEIAQRQETKFHGVSWGLSYAAAIEKAKAENKPVLVDFTGTWCQNCRLMEQFVFPKPEVAKALGDFVTVSVFVDSVPIGSITPDQRRELAGKNATLQLDLLNNNSIPYYVVITPDGKVIDAKASYNEVPVFVDFLSQALAKHKGEGR